MAFGLISRDKIIIGPKNGESIELSEKGKKIKNIIETKVSKDRQAISELFSVLLDEKIEITNGRYPLPGTALILLNNPNSHNYPLGEVLIHMGSGVCMRSDGTVGNQAPVNLLDLNKHWRYATEKEVDEAFNENIVQPVSMKINENDCVEEKTLKVVNLSEVLSWPEESTESEDENK